MAVAALGGYPPYTYQFPNDTAFGASASKSLAVNGIGTFAYVAYAKDTALFGDRQCGYADRDQRSRHAEPGKGENQPAHPGLGRKLRQRNNSSVLTRAGMLDVRIMPDPGKRRHNWIPRITIDRDQPRKLHRLASQRFGQLGSRPCTYAHRLAIGHAHHHVIGGAHRSTSVPLVTLTLLPAVKFRTALPLLQETPERGGVDERKPRHAGLGSLLGPSVFCSPAWRIRWAVVMMRCAACSGISSLRSQCWRFPEQPAAEQRRLLKLLVEKATWKHGGLETTLRPPFQKLRVSNQGTTRKHEGNRGTGQEIKDWLPR
jgi:hypothetical protein